MPLNSGYKNIANVKFDSSNQLKSRDLSIKTASNEAEALRQFADDWAHCIGNDTSVHIPTYGVLVYGRRFNTIDMATFEEIGNQILQDNRSFIPRAEIKHIGWLTRKVPTKTASTITIESTMPEDANKIMDEGLIWQGELFQCERYERQCRVKQCYKCERYGHIGAQCKAATVCGCPVQEHNTRECPPKAGQSVPRKCAGFWGGHEAWSRQCPTRKDKIAKAKAAYDVRPRHHHITDTRGQFFQPEIRIITTRMNRSS